MRSMARYYYRPWKDESLASALHFLRCRMVREGDEGLEHVDALLSQLGVDPDSLPMPRKTPRHYARGELQRSVLDALRSGPQRSAEIAAKVQGDLDPKLAYKRTYQVLHRLKERGLVANEAGVWRFSAGR